MDSSEYELINSTPRQLSAERPILLPDPDSSEASVESGPDGSEDSSASTESAASSASSASDQEFSKESADSSASAEVSAAALPDLRTIALKIAYDGTNFRGWQRQPNGLRTVQGTIEDALESLVFPNGTPLSMRPEQMNWPVIEVKGSSRTDAGVHALGQVGAFRTRRLYRDKAWMGALNARLPFDVRILESWQANGDFNPIGDTKRKRYRYCLFNAADLRGALFLRPYAWGVRGPLDIDLMRQGADKLIGTHDCYGWANSGGKRDDTIRTILDAKVETTVCPKTGVELILVEVEGTGFLYNMVRNIAGTLAEIGQKKLPVDCIDKIFEQRDRTQGGITAPPGGLYLVQIWYE